MGDNMKKELDINLKYQIEEYYDNKPFIPLSKEKYVEYINGLIKKVQIKDNNDLIYKIKNYTLSLWRNSRIRFNSRRNIWFNKSFREI